MNEEMNKRTNPQYPNNSNNNNIYFFKSEREPSDGLEVKDSVLSPLWCGFHPWPGSVYMQHAQPKVNKIKKSFVITT